MISSTVEFLAARDVANQIAERYRRALDGYVAQYNILIEIFAGTSVGACLTRLDDQVIEAVRLNEDAGWLPAESKFTPEEFFRALIRRDHNAQARVTLDHVPGIIEEAFEAHDGASFDAFANELRVESLEANLLMNAIQEEMKETPTEGDLFATLRAWSTESTGSEQAKREAGLLSDNLCQSWLRCQSEGLALLCMADKFDGPDPALD